MQRMLFHLATALVTFGLGVTLAALWLGLGATPSLDDVPPAAALNPASSVTTLAPPPELVLMPDAPVPLALAEQPCRDSSDGTPEPDGWWRSDHSDAQASPGDVRGTITISRPAPVYPAAARAAGVSGVVVVRITVDECGGVESAAPVSGPPLLRPAAVEAARRARFVPARQAGQPVRMFGKIAYNFLLQ